MRRIGDWLVMIFLMAASLSDWKHKKIPIILLVIMSAAVGLIVCFIGNESRLSMTGGVVLGVLFWITSVCTKEAIGYGDSWIVTVLGIYLGGKKLLGLLMTAFLLSGIYSLVCLLRFQWKRSVTIPFIPFLAIAYIGVMFL